MEGFNKVKIAVLGGGFAGVRVCLELTKLLPNTKILLINDTPFHSFHTDLYEVATAALDKEVRLEFKDLSGTVNIPFEKIFQGKNIEILVDKVKEVDLLDNFVATASKEIEFEYLVISTGSDTNFFGIPGAEKYAHPLKSTEDALNIRNDIDEHIFHSNSPITVVVAGGGFTGVELSGELVGFLDKLAKKHHKSVGKVVILEAAPNVLSGMPTWAQETALKRLKNLSVEVFLNHTIKKVDDKNIYCENDQKIPYDYLIWTTGIKGASLNEKIKGIEPSKKGQLRAESNLSLKEYPNVFVLGDVAECIDQKRGVPVAATAWAAIGQGKLAAENLYRKILGKQLVDYHPPNPAFVVPIGGKFALSNVAGLQISGLLGWMLKRLVALKYLLSILPFIEAFRLWRKGVIIYSTND